MIISTAPAPFSEVISRLLGGGVGICKGWLSKSRGYLENHFVICTRSAVGEQQDPSMAARLSPKSSLAPHLQSSSDNTAEEPTGRRMQENGDYTVVSVWGLASPLVAPGKRSHVLKRKICHTTINT